VSTRIAKLIAQHEMREVLRRLKTAGWWAVDPETGREVPPPVDKGKLMNAVPGTDPTDGASYVGDGPADMMDEALKRINEAYKSAWGRSATPEELQSVWTFCTRPIMDGTVKLAKDSVSINDFEFNRKLRAAWAALEEDDGVRLQGSEAWAQHLRGSDPKDLHTAAHEWQTGDGTEVWTGFRLPPEVAEGFSPLGDEDRSPPHVTLLYLGRVDLDRQDEVLDIIHSAVASWGRPTRAYHTGIDYFEQPFRDGRCAINRVRFDDDLSDLRHRLREALLDAGHGVEDGFPLVYQPHTTVAYLDGPEATWDAPVPGGEWVVTELEVWGLPKVHKIPLGAPAATSMAQFRRTPPPAKTAEGVRSMGFLTVDEVRAWGRQDLDHAREIGFDAYVDETRAKGSDFGPGYLQTLRGEIERPRLASDEEWARFAGIFDPPPKVFEPVFEWMAQKYAMHTLWNIQSEMSEVEYAVERFPKADQFKRQLRQLKEVEKACKAFGATRPRRYKTSASKTFPIDLSGWKYLNPELLNKRVVKENENVEKAIEAAKRNFAGAEKLFRWLKKTQGTGGEAVDHVYYLSAEVRKEAGSLATWAGSDRSETDGFRGFWDFHNVITHLFHAGEMDFSGAEPQGHYKRRRVTLSELEAMILPPASPAMFEKTVAAILKSKGFDKFKAILDFKGKKRRGGQWNPHKMQLEVGIWRKYADTTAVFTDEIDRIERVLIHETMHLGQDALRLAHNLHEDAGLASKEKRFEMPAFRSRGMKKLRQELKRGPSKGRAMPEHPLREVEFETDLRNAVFAFIKETRRIHPSERPAKFHEFVGSRGEPENWYFQVWKAKAPELWQEGVKQLYKELDRQGVFFVPELVKTAEWERWAKKFTINIGDPVLTGKFLNSPGVVRGFGTTSKGDPTIIVQKGKEGDGAKKEVKLFKLRYDKERARNWKRRKKAVLGGDITRLVMFDFDGTLFRGEEATPEWWADPKPFSWGANPVSMNPPCVPKRPGSEYWNSEALAGLREATNDPHAYTLLVTGRVKAHRPRVRELLKQQGTTPSALHFNPGVSAVQFKKKLLGQILAGMPTIDTVEIWENENLSAYTSFVESVGSRLGRPIRVIPHQVRDRDLPYACGPEDLRGEYPVLASTEEWAKFAGGKCSPHSHSYGWIDPKGKVHEVGYLTHAMWAFEALNGVRPTVEDDTAGRVDLASKALMDQGWIRVANGLNFGVRGRPTPAAWKAAANMTAECVISMRGRGKWDPEEGYVWLDGHKPNKMFIANFVRKFGGREVEFHMFDKMAADAKYKSKKEVPKTDGDGTTTVYEYGPRQVSKRNKDKAERIEKLRKNITKLRSQVERDLDADDEAKRLTALAVALIDETFERVGNPGSAEKGHYGVTGWLTDHVTVSDGKATLKYVGKSGVKQEKVIENKKVVSALREAIKDKGEGETICSGTDCQIEASDVNEYLKPFDVTAKDLRGFHANQEMQARLKAKRSKGEKLPHGRKEKDEILKAEFKEALEETAKAVGHEPSTLRSQYLVPGLEDAYVHDGTVEDKLDKTGSWSDVLLTLQWKQAGGGRTLYHIGKRPAQPRPNIKGWTWNPDGPYKRKWLPGGTYSVGVFLTPDPLSVAKHHGVMGHVYAYKVPEKVIRDSGGIHRYEKATEVIIPEEYWHKVRFLGKSMDKSELRDKIHPAGKTRREDVGSEREWERTIEEVDRQEEAARVQRAENMTPDEKRRLWEDALYFAFGKESDARRLYREMLTMTHEERRELLKRRPSYGGARDAEDLARWFRSKMQGRTPLRVAGRVVQFPTGKARKPRGPTIKIQGKEYALSNYWAAMDVGDDPGPRVIKGPGTGKYRYLWFYDTDRQDVDMWRVSDGEPKAGGPARSMSRELFELDRRGQLNRGTTSELKAIERFMRKRSREALQAMKDYLKEVETDYQRTVNEVALELFDRKYRPEIERRVAEVKAGVVPIGFKARPSMVEHGFSEEHQAISHVIMDVFGEFTYDKVDDELRKRGFDPDDPNHDIQASYWAVGDIRDGYLEERRTGRRFKFGTKSDAEKEDEEVERLVRPEPKKKPPRNDLRRERVRERDPDLEDKADATHDKDLSRNYKRIGALLPSSEWTKWAGKVPADKEEKRPGDYWQTESGWGVFPPKAKQPTSAPDEPSAKAIAEGKKKDEEKKDEGEKPEGETAPEKEMSRDEAVVQKIEDAEAELEAMLAEGFDEDARRDFGYLLQQELKGLQEDEKAKVPESTDALLRSIGEMIGEPEIADEIANEVAERKREQEERTKPIPIDEFVKMLNAGPEEWGMEESVKAETVKEVLEEQGKDPEKPVSMDEWPRVFEEAAESKSDFLPFAPDAEETLKKKQEEEAQAHVEGERQKVVQEKLKELAEKARKKEDQRVNREVNKVLKSLRVFDDGGSWRNSGLAQDLQAYLKDMSPEERTDFTASYQARLMELHKKSADGFPASTLKAAEKAIAEPLGKPGSSPDTKARALAMATFAMERVANPEWAGGKQIEEGVEATEEALEERAARALAQYRDASPEMRKEAVSQLGMKLHQLPQDAPEREQYERVADALALVAAANGEALEINAEVVKRDKAGNPVYDEKRIAKAKKSLTDAQQKYKKEKAKPDADESTLEWLESNVKDAEKELKEAESTPLREKIEGQLRAPPSDDYKVLAKQALEAGLDEVLLDGAGNPGSPQNRAAVKQVANNLYWDDEPTQGGKSTAGLDRLGELYKGREDSWGEGWSGVVDWIKDIREKAGGDPADPETKAAKRKLKTAEWAQSVLVHWAAMDMSTGEALTRGDVKATPEQRKKREEALKDARSEDTTRAKAIEEVNKCLEKAMTQEEADKCMEKSTIDILEGDLEVLRKVDGELDMSHPIVAQVARVVETGDLSELDKPYVAQGEKPGQRTPQPPSVTKVDIQPKVKVSPTEETKILPSKEEKAEKPEKPAPGTPEEAEGPKKKAPEIPKPETPEEAKAEAEKGEEKAKEIVEETVEKPKRKEFHELLPAGGEGRMKTFEKIRNDAAFPDARSKRILKKVEDGKELTPDEREDFYRRFDEVDDKYRSWLTDTDEGKAFQKANDRMKELEGSLKTPEEFDEFIALHDEIDKGIEGFKTHLEKGAEGKTIEEWSADYALEDAEKEGERYEPGDTWTTDNGYEAGKNPDGDIEVFSPDDPEAKAKAEAWAKGEKPEKPEKKAAWGQWSFVPGAKWL